jgi:hypothetical protein
MGLLSDLVPYDFLLVVLYTNLIISSIRSGCSEIVFDFEQFIEGQTHFSTSWHAKMSLTVNEPI